MKRLGRRRALQVVAGGALGTAVADAADDPPRGPELKGVWYFRSYLINQASDRRGDATAVSWAPLGKLTVKTEAGGKVTGELILVERQIPCDVAGKVTAGKLAGTADVELTITGRGQLAAYVYELKGGLIPATPDPHEKDAMGRVKPAGTGAKPSIRGFVRNLGPDLGGADPGSVGTFVLVPE